MIELGLIVISLWTLGLVYHFVKMTLISISLSSHLKRNQSEFYEQNKHSYCGRWVCFFKDLHFLNDEQITAFEAKFNKALKHLVVFVALSICSTTVLIYLGFL